MSVTTWRAEGLAVIASVSTLCGIVHSAAQPETQFTKQTLARTAEAFNVDDQIMHIEETGDGAQLIVLTNRDARWYSRQGEMVRSVKFPHSLWAPVVATPGPGRAPIIIGLRSVHFGSSYVDLLTLDGKRIIEVKAWQYADVRLANVTGDSEKEILIRQRNGVTILDLEGRQLGFARAAEYLHQFYTLDTDADGRHELVMWMDRVKGGGALAQVVSVGGRELSRWRLPAGSRLSVIQLAEQPSLLAAIDGDTVRMLSAAGTVLKVYEAPGAAGLRYLFAGQLPNGSMALLASGGGSAHDSVLWVYDRQGRVSYQDRFKGRSWTLAVSRLENRFFVGNGIHLFSYRSSH